MTQLTFGSQFISISASTF